MTRKLTKAQQGILYLVRAEGRIILDGRSRRPAEALAQAGLADISVEPLLDGRGACRVTVTALCGTVGCKRPVTEEVSYRWRNGDERDTERTCTACADGYERRIVMASFTRRPLFEGTLQVQQRSWTTGVNPSSSWADLRPAHPFELALLREIPDGGSAFWLRPDGTSYYALGARSNADQLVRVVRS
jgi:hypothetical protein